MWVTLFRDLGRGLFGLALSILLLAPGYSAGDESSRVPKYGPAAQRLLQARGYIRAHEAPDFWVLMPYYVSQPDDQSCSAACVSMLVNAFRAERELRADEPLATPASVLETVDGPLWRSKLGLGEDGVTLDELAAFLPRVLAAHGLETTQSEIMRFPGRGEEALSRLRRLLSDNERSACDLVLVNFRQSVLTRDPAGDVGHFAPIAAYDAEQRRVLLFDPDRQWYEPYWVSDTKLLEAMATRDSVSGRPRGLIHISAQRDEKP